MKVYSKTDKGLVRSSNQDSMAVGRFEGGVYGVVCDGMGGANGGDYASAKAVEVIDSVLKDRINADMSGSEIRSLLQEAIKAANMHILEQSLTDFALSGMGTTVVIAVADEKRLLTAHVGDSRAYLISGGRISQLTRDHSMVQEMVDLGQITQDEARNHPRKNIITRALGVDSRISIDYTESETAEGDIVLLCSDGLSNYLDDSELLGLSQSAPADRLCELYIEKANENGGGDNITALVIQK